MKDSCLSPRSMTVSNFEAFVEVKGSIQGLISVFNMERYENNRKEVRGLRL